MLAVSADEAAKNFWQDHAGSLAPAEEEPFAGLGAETNGNCEALAERNAFFRGKDAESELAAVVVKP
jgi:hypothetical protein